MEGEQDLQDRSALFNNAGVRVMLTAGPRHYRIALELFRGALESKLRFERSRQLGNEHNSQQQHEQEGDNNPGIQVIQQQQGSVTTTESATATAENHLLHLDSYLNEDEDEDESTAPTAASPASGSGNITRAAMVVPVDSRGYIPFICFTPFVLPDNQQQQATSMNFCQASDSSFAAASCQASDSSFPSTAVSREQRSAMIVFNLGLVHQCLNRHSEKPAGFYEIAAGLLDSEEQDYATSTDARDSSLPLRIAIINNFGVWSYENEDCPEASITCMEQLHEMLEQQQSARWNEEDHNDNHVALDETVRQGIHSNIRWILMPSNGGSPAA